MAATTEQSHETQPKKRPGFDAELKRRLVDHLDMLKRPNDIVRVTQITNHHFRVNTMSPVRGSGRRRPDLPDHEESVPACGKQNRRAGHQRPDPPSLNGKPALHRLETPSPSQPIARAFPFLPV